MISSDVASCCSIKATSPIQESSNFSRPAIDSKNKHNSSCLLREPTRESESTDFVDQIIDMCTNQNPLYKLDNQISNHMWVNYD